MALSTTRKITLALFATFWGLMLQAQDPHFSQFYTFASQLNPALVGNYDGSFRAAAIYRNQWSYAIPKQYSGYQTAGADLDVSFLEGSLRKSKFAGGISAFVDRSGQSGLEYINASISLSYHQGFGQKGNHRLSIGMQGSFVNKKLMNDAIFGDQFNNYNRPKPTSEDYYTRGIITGGLATGLYWRSNFREKVKFGLGIGAYNLLQPKENFMTDSLGGFGQQYARITADLNMEIYFGKKKNLSISPEFVLMMQGPAREINPGLFFTYYLQTGFRRNNNINFGLRYRVGDAIIPMLHIQFYNLRIGAAYDVNISPLKNSTRHQGAFEISLSYIGESVKYFKGSKSLPSRRF